MTMIVLDRTCWGPRYQRRSGGGCTWRSNIVQVVELFMSELSTVFLDDHESWYAVHWTTKPGQAHPRLFANQYLNIDGDTPTFLQTSEDTKSEPFSHQHADINQKDERAIRFVRIDVQNLS